MINIKELKEKSCIYIAVGVGDGSVYELVSINQIDENRMVVSNGKDEYKVDFSSMIKQLFEIPIDDILLRALGFVGTEQTLYGLPKQLVYSKPFEIKGYGHFTINVLFDYNQSGWAIVDPSPDSEFGCKFVFVRNLHLLQNAITQRSGAIWSINPLMLHREIKRLIEEKNKELQKNKTPNSDK